MLKILKEFVVVGEVGDVELDSGGEVTFQGGFALKEPAGYFEELSRVVTGDGQGGVMKGVRLDEGAVEVDTEHRESGDFNFRGRRWQKCPFLRLKS